MNLVPLRVIAVLNEGSSYLNVRTDRGDGSVVVQGAARWLRVSLSHWEVANNFEDEIALYCR